MEFEAIDEGTIAQILIPEGTDNVKVGTVIATIAGEGEEAPAEQKTVAPAQAGAASSGEPAPAAPASAGATAESAPAPVAEKPAPAERASDPAIPAGTAHQRLPLREALRVACAAEMQSELRRVGTMCANHFIYR